MKIKANRNLYKNILIAFCSLIIFIGTLAYFLGFDLNIKSLLYYAIFLTSTIIVFFGLFLIIDKINKKYIVFDNDKIIEMHSNEEKVILYFNQILYTKYHNNIDLLYGNIDFGYVEIVYKTDSKDKEPKSLNLYLSKKNYKKIFNK
ncbi:MAG: hypothetical protein IJX02_02265 [Clostridia bacterium]|nr:hypothetical protein [Clostridia bacterium]